AFIEQNIVVLLVRIGFLSDFIHENLPVENSVRFVFIDSFIILVTFAIRSFVMNGGVVIHSLFASDNRNSVHERVDILSVMNEIKIVSYEFSTKSESVHRS